MFPRGLLITILAVFFVGRGDAQTQRQNRDCVTPDGYLGSCNTAGQCADSGGPSPACAPGQTCCLRVTSGRGQVTGDPPPSPPARRRQTLLQPQFQCGGQPAPEVAPRDPSAIVFRERRQVKKLPPAPAAGPPPGQAGSGAVFVTGGAPEPETNAVGVGVISSKPPKPPTLPSLQDVLARIGSPPRTSTNRGSFGSVGSNSIAPPPPLPTPAFPGRRRGRRPASFQRPFRRNYRRRNYYPRRNYTPRREHRRPSYYQAPRNYRQPRQNYYRQPRNYYRQPRNYDSPPRYYHTQRQSYRPRRGLLDHVLSLLGLPSRRRYRRSPQTPDEQAAFESLWQEYLQRVRAGSAPAGLSRRQILEAYRAAAAEAAAEAARNPGPTSAAGGWTCGAVLISERYMLTAAHCLLSGRPQVVRLGDLNLTATGDGAPQEYRVQEVVPHPGYRHPLVYHDLALLRLDRRVRFSEHVRPFCLYGGGSSLVGEVAHVSGWGATEFGGGLSDTLLGGNLTIWSRRRCSSVYSQQPGFQRRLPEGITSDLLCAGGQEQDACQGDSGGPMTVLTESGTRLAGIVSAGIGCGTPGIPGIYTNVARYVGWIDGVVYGRGG